jgi:phosphoribosylamine--glycine ligase
MGIVYRGVLYAGLMITKDGPSVIEYNCRFGDPETQVVLPRLKTDFVNVCMAVAKGELSRLRIEWDDRPAASIVLASKGYPGSYPKGMEITGLADAAKTTNVHVFHAGTAKKEGKVVTAGGRVLCVTGVGKTIQDALKAAYQGVSLIHFEGAQFRKDIGWRALQHK